MERTIETLVATTLMRRLFLIQVRKSVFWKRKRVVVDDDAGLHPERDRLEVVQLGVRLERRHEHEIEGEEREEHEGHEVARSRTRSIGFVRRGSWRVAMAHSFRM